MPGAGGPRRDTDRCRAAGHAVDYDRVGANRTVIAELDPAQDPGPSPHENAIADGWKLPGIAHAHRDRMDKAGVGSDSLGHDDHPHWMGEVEAWSDRDITADLQAKPEEVEPFQQ